jgi:hypothetical protein
VATRKSSITDAAATKVRAVLSAAAFNHREYLIRPTEMQIADWGAPL